MISPEKDGLSSKEKRAVARFYAMWGERVRDGVTFQFYTGGGKDDQKISKCRPGCSRLR